MSPPKNYVPSFRIVIGGTELQHGSTVDVLSVSVTETMNQADSFTFTVRDRHPTPGRLFAGGDELHWMDSGAFDEGNEVEIYMGYMEDMPLMLRGEITAVSPNFPGSGPPTLTIQGQTLYHRLQRARRREPFEAASDSDIAQEIARAMDLKAEVDDTEVQHDLVSPNGATYASFLQERAGRLNYEVAVKDGTLYFQRRRYIENPTPALTLEWGKDLISFRLRLSLYNATTQVTVRGPQTSQGRGKDPLVGTAQAGDERAKMGDVTGGELALSAFGSFGENNLLVEDHNISSAQEANDVALARLEGQALDFIIGQGACAGNPSLLSRQMIELKGLGRRYSGSYYVTSTTHTIDSGGYRTDFEAKRNAR
jgi:uncharacterized protein